MTRASTPAGRPFWALSAREARAHAFVACLALWIIAAWFVVAAPGPRDRFGQLKGSDFVHFHTIGRVAVERDAGLLYDAEALSARQLAHVPASRGDRYLPVYPPQVALFFAPIAVAPYATAAVLWALLTLAGYLGLTWGAARTLRQAGADRPLLVLAALGAPGFWYLILHGQSTLIPLIGAGLAGAALERGRPLAAGLALGLLAAKPQLGVLLAVVLLMAAEWRIVAGALISLAVQAGVVAGWFGSEVFSEYGRVLRELPALVSQLEPRPYQLHSWRAILPPTEGPWRDVVWLVASVTLAYLAWRTWKAKTVPVGARFATALTASVLASPHATVYDLAVLSPAVAWIGGWVERAWPDRERRRFWGLVYLSWPVLLAPTALWLGLQASVIVLTGLIVLVARHVPWPRSPR